MHIAVIIVAFRNLADVQSCIAALEQSTHRDFEIVVCENGGSDAFRKLRDALPSVLASGQPVQVVAAHDNPGYAGGVNRCVAAAPDAQAWWILNPDTVPAPDAMALMAAALADGPFDAVGCTVHYPDGTVESRGGHWRPWLARAVSLEHSRPLDAPADPASARALNFLNGASMLVGREFVARTGPMREDYFLYVEEVEWCLRGLGTGLRLGVEPRAAVMHHKGTTTGSEKDFGSRSRASVYLDERNKMLCTRDRYPLRLPVAAVAALILLGLRFGKRRAWTQLGHAASGWLAGLRGQRGKPAWIA